MKTAICCIARNEARNIAEWILFHNSIGFDTVILYDHLSDDGMRQIAQKAAQLGNIDLRIIEWGETESPQTRAYIHAVQNHALEFDWICFIDSDEFVIPSRDGNVKAFLRSMGAYSAIAVNWVCYGSSGHIEFPEGLIIDNFVSRAPINFSMNRHTKVFVRPEAIKQVVNPHYMMLKDTYDYVTPLGSNPKWLKLGKTADVVGTNIIRINHYFTRSRAHFMEKLNRPRVSKVHVPRLDNFAETDRNDEIDNAALNLNAVLIEGVRSFSRSSVFRVIMSIIYGTALLAYDIDV